MNQEPAGCTNGYWMPTLVADDDFHFDRDDLLSQFRSHGIDARVFFWPLSPTPLEGGKAFDHTCLSESIHLRALNLPSGHDLTDEDIQLVSEIVFRNLP